jgi:cellulose synthase/poly-beta-1,6-N-acetylglucosamine synthase-like glycosyltransferase
MSPQTDRLVWQAIFWSACALIVYAYALYPVLLFLASSAVETARAWQRLLGRSDAEPAAWPDDGWPPVSIVVAAHNEERELPGLIDSLRRLEYAPGRMEVIIVSDGSSDGTNAWLAALREPWIRVYLINRRQGKAAALNFGVAHARHDLLLLTDASTRHEPATLRRLVRHFRDPRVGVVCGALRFHHHAGSESTEGAYWSYECLLRLLEGRLGATLTASGALYALRRSCFPRLSAAAWIEDFLVPMHARRAGYRVLYDPEAMGWEVPAPTVGGEFRRRVRLAIGSLRGLRDLLTVKLDLPTRWALISHKLLRWCVPFLLLIALLANCALASLPFYRFLLFLQLALYALAAIGGRARRSRIPRALYFFLAMNAAFFWGVLLFLRGHRDTAWQQVR